MGEMPACKAVSRNDCRVHTSLLLCAYISWSPCANVSVTMPLVLPCCTFSLTFHHLYPLIWKVSELHFVDVTSLSVHIPFCHVPVSCEKCAFFPYCSNIAQTFLIRHNMCNIFFLTNYQVMCLVFCANVANGSVQTAQFIQHIPLVLHILD